MYWCTTLCPVPFGLKLGWFVSLIMFKTQFQSLAKFIVCVELVPCEISPTIVFIPCHASPCVLVLEKLFHFSFVIPLRPIYLHVCFLVELAFLYVCHSLEMPALPQLEALSCVRSKSGFSICTCFYLFSGEHIILRNSYFSQLELYLLSFLLGLFLSTHHMSLMS